MKQTRIWSSRFLTTTLLMLISLVLQPFRLADAAALLRDPFRLTQPASVIIQQTDGRTRVALFVWNLTLAANEPAASVVVTLVDAQAHSFEIAAEDVRPLVGVDMTQVTFRLPDNLAVGTCSVKISAQGRVSNTGTIRIL